MNSTEKIKEELNKALKIKDECKISTLRILLTGIHNKEIELRKKEEGLSEEEIQNVVRSEIKKRKDAAEAYEKGNRPELAEKEKKELEILTEYVPKQMNEEEIRKIVKEKITDTSDIGKLMGVLMSQLKGKADGSLVRKIVQEELKKDDE